MLNDIENENDVNPSPGGIHHKVEEADKTILPLKITEQDMEVHHHAHLRSLEKFDRQGTINALGFYAMSALSSTRTIHLQRYIDLNTELLKVLRREYGME